MMSNLKVVTFNLRCVWIGDGINSGIHRAGMIYEKILKELPDVILFQETRDRHLEFLTRVLPEYAFYGHFREADFTGEGLYTAIRKETMQVLGYDSYWLSPTPYIPGSRFENQSDCPRTCLTLKLREKRTNKVFKMANVHLDHISDAARIEGIQMALERAYEDKQIDDVPYLLGGDFNATPDSTTIQYCNHYDKFKIYDVTNKITGTFHDFGRRDGDFKIDYIYITEEIKNAVISVTRWEDCDDGIYLSDHYPVCLEFDSDKL